MVRYSDSVTVRLTPALKQSLEARARREHRSLASVCRRVLAAAAPDAQDQPCLAFAPPCPHERTYVVNRRRVCVDCNEGVPDSRQVA